MKEIKITIAVLILIAMGMLAWYWSGDAPPPSPVDSTTPQVNAYVTKIQQEIEALRKAPVRTFSYTQYENTKYLITDYHQQNLLANNTNDAKQWKEILSKDLYTAYALKFKEQAMQVFENSEWAVEDINIIRREVKELQSSAYLENGSPLADAFRKITSILAKYDEISGFIRNCKGFEYTEYGIEDKYPDVSDKIQQAKTYLANNLDNSYVSNCFRLREDLQSVPILLFDKHVIYLRATIEQNAVRYREYTVQVEYSRNIYTPLRNQLRALNNELYGLADDALFSREYEGVERLLASYNMQATNHFVSLMNKQ